MLSNPFKAVMIILILVVSKSPNSIYASALGSDSSDTKETCSESSDGISGSTILKGIGLIGLGVCLIPPLAGFGVSGIAANSAAAAVQSSIGNVASGTLFSGLQSLAMKGIFAKGAAMSAAAVGTGYAVEQTSSSDCKDE